MNIMYFQHPLAKWFLGGLLLVLGLVLVFDQDVGIALLMLLALSAATVVVLRRLGVCQREVYLLFALALVSHAAFALFVHYAEFQPFGGGPEGGDFARYSAAAKEIAERVRAGNFSLSGVEGIPGLTYFPAIIGYVYALVTPAMVVGQLFLVWAAALAVLVVYFLAQELGASRPWAFLVGALGNVYPSFVFFTSYMMKEALVVLFALLSLLLLLRIIKQFSWQTYALLFLVAIPLANLRSEVYDAVAITFFISWLVFARMQVRRRVALGLVLIALYGLAPLIATGNGYYDHKNFQEELSIEKAVSLKENAYLAVVPSPSQSGESAQPVSKPDDLSSPSQREEPAPPVPEPGESTPVQKEPEVQGGRDSTVNTLQVGEESLASFVWNQVRALAFVVLGPFPWQFSQPRHAATLVETIPWLLVLPFVVRGMWRKVRKDRHFESLALVLFALLLFALVAFFINNFGIVMRIRMPAVLALLPFLAFAFSSPYPPFFGTALSVLPRGLRERFGLADWGGKAIQKVMDELERRGVKVSSLRTLDMFAGEGIMQTIGYAHRVKELEAWEIDPQFASSFQKNIPSAKVRLANSMEEMRKPEQQGKYDLLVIDNHTMCYGPQEKYCEHFEVLPNALSLLNPKEGMVVFNVNREPPGLVQTKTHQERKAAFYGLNKEEKKYIDLEFLKTFYTELFEKQGYKAQFLFSVSRGGAHRNDYLHYFVFSVTKGGGPH